MRRSDMARGVLPAVLLFAATCSPAPETVAPLVSVPEPDLAAVESLVQEQLSARRTSLDELVEAGDRDPGTLGAAFGDMGKLYHAYDLLEPAEACYRNATQLQGKVPAWHYLLGLVLERRGRLDQAAQAFRAALQLQPDDAAVLLHLGQAELASNEIEAARDHFAAAIAADSSCQAARFGLGEVARRAGDLAAAADYFLEVLAQQPSAQQVHYPLAQVLSRLGRDEEAQTHLQASQQRALNVGGRPHCTDPLDLELAQIRTGAAAAMRRGLLLGLAGKPEQEIALLRQAVEQSPQDPALRQRLGKLLLEGNDLEGARVQLEAALRLAPGDPRAHMDLGVAAARNEQYEFAERHFRKALEIDPSSSHYRMQLALALQRQGLCEEPIEHYSKVLLAEPTHRQALLQRSACLAKTGRPQAAGRDMANLLDSHPPEDLGERLRLASMLLSVGQDDTALRHFGQIVESSAPAPLRAQANLLIGQVHLRRGNRDEAGESFRRAVELDPRLAELIPPS